MTRIALASLMILALAACGDEPAGKTTAKLDAVEVQPGTISDSMIILDDAAGDGTAVDNSVPDDGSAKPVEKAEDESDDAAADDEASDESAEAVTTAVGKRVETPVPAKKSADE